MRGRSDAILSFPSPAWSSTLSAIVLASSTLYSAILGVDSSRSPRRTIGSVQKVCENSIPQSSGRSKDHVLASFRFRPFFAAEIMEWKAITNFGKLYTQFKNLKSARRITSGQENSFISGHERAI